MVLKGAFHRTTTTSDDEKAGEITTMIAKNFWGDDALLRSGHLSHHSVVCKKAGSVLTLTSADFR